MELRHLRYFVAVAETLNFGRAAARAAHRAAAAVARDPRARGRSSARRCSTRSTRGVRLTAAGAALLPEARRLLRDADGAARRRAAPGGRRRRHACASGFISTASYNVLPRDLPGVPPRAVRASGCAARGDVGCADAAQLATGEIDVGFVLPASPTPALAYTPLHARAAGRRAARATALAARACRLPHARGRVVHPVPARGRRGALRRDRRLLPSRGLHAAHRPGGDPDADDREPGRGGHGRRAGAGVAASTCGARVWYIAPLAETSPAMEIGLAWRAGDDSPLVARVRRRGARARRERHRDAHPSRLRSDRHQLRPLPRRRHDARAVRDPLVRAHVPRRVRAGDRARRMRARAEHADRLASRRRRRHALLRRVRRDPRRAPRLRAVLQAALLPRASRSRSSRCGRAA